MLFVLGYYLLGEGIKKGMGIFTALFLPLINMPYLASSSLIPNMLGYSMMLFSMYLLLRYIDKKRKEYLLFFIILTSSIALIHTFPVIILTLFLLSLTIYHLFILKKYRLIVFYWVSFIVSMLFAFCMVFTKMAKTVVSYSMSTDLCSEPMIKTIHNILAGLGIIYLYIWQQVSKTPIDNTSTFLISLVFTPFLILGVYNFVVNKIKNGIPFIFLLIFLILNIVVLKILCIPIPLPFFNHQYDSARMALHIQAIMPIFYGSGLYYLYRKVESIKNINIYNLVKPLFITFILLFAFFSAHTNYEILKERGRYIYVIDDNDLKVFEWMNKNNISNQRILNFGWYAGQYLPIYTTNEPVYTFYRFATGNTTFGGLSFKELISSVDSKNYTKFLEACRTENITYVYLSDCIGKYGEEFFNNSKYFEILYQVGNAKIIKIKYNNS